MYMALQKFGWENPQSMYAIYLVLGSVCLRFGFIFWGPEAVGQTNSKKYKSAGEKR
jgi:hypothetical protein